ncbi:LacI family DNA-binding transcriptional regulator [Jiangella alkaliphila]|uniref:DNA-binding transcriptional regulator, LacI/PurR family n=1 Tax=Jiangella alkaliphila TaxID=419479 RepID=A0A1H2G2P2_9ACTN|nr:LacI family DNA-binding transcriptional regulator [Jiangella alkaliphila]SDU13548.1 DNA-binding transcriptional regulator, LacI/PurR family [Jiangella alkaliphila]
MTDSESERTSGSRRSRQADVAREAGVSQSTVSMVLTGAGDLGRISPETQRRVLEAARQLDYIPAAQSVRVGWPVTRQVATRQATARQAASRQAGSRQAAARQLASPLLLGVHTFEPIFPTSARDYYFEFLRGIEVQAGAEGHNLVLFTAAQDEDGVRRIYQDNLNRLGQATGSLLLGYHPHRDDLAHLAADGYPFAYIGHREVSGAEISYVGGDYRSGTGRIVDELVAMGHRTFAYLGDALRDEPQVDRWDGFSSALGRFGLPVPEPAYDRPDELTAQWLDGVLDAGATVVMVESVGLLRVLTAMAGLRGLSIPDDLSVVLLVDDPGGEVGGREWASLQVPRNAMGRRAVRLLTSLITDPQGDYERQILLPCTHTLEGSVSPPRG